MKSALIIACFDSYSYNVRTKYVEEYLTGENYKVEFLISDFDHRMKDTYSCQRKNVEYIHVPKYKKNMSICRMISHCIFALKVKKYLNTHVYDVVYITTPPNFLFYTLKSFKKNHLIFEIGDLWPETFPNRIRFKIMDLFFFTWRKLRDYNLSNNNYYLYECKLFETIINNNTKNSLKGKTIYLCKNDTHKRMVRKLDNEKFRLLYLGSINNIIDIDLIIELCQSLKMKKPVVLSIVGVGERKEELLNRLRNIDIELNDYGSVFDEKDKEIIFSDCNFALNIMKSSVCVGLTMKSIDYFSYGIPLISNISFDSEEIIEKNNCGFNINKDNVNKVAELLSELSDDEYQCLVKNTYKTYEKFFSVYSFNKSFAEVLNNLN